MRGHPKRIGCEQDFKNLMTDFPEVVKEHLVRIQASDSAAATVTRVVSGSEETKNLVVATIANPSLIRTQLGIKSAKGISDLIQAADISISSKNPVEEPIEEAMNGK